MTDHEIGFEEWSAKNRADDRETVRIIAEFFLELFSMDPTGTTSWLEMSDEDAEAFYRKVGTFANSPQPIKLPPLRMPELPWEERPLCIRCGLEDGACICAHFPRGKKD